MELMSNVFGVKRKQLFTLKQRRNEKIAGVIKEENFKDIKCPLCKNEFSGTYIRKKLYVCPDCEYHIPIGARHRIKIMLDKGSFKEQNAELITKNPLKFPGYKSKLKAAAEKSGLKDAIVCGKGTINGIAVEVAVLDSNFMMGSMGTVVGEKYTRAVEYAMKNNLPFISVAASGGARMQEGLFSLMQMAKTSAAIEKFKQNGGLYISILTHPTTGGVSASFAMLGDIIIAEPGALIGFAGPRVIEQTIKESLPSGFQRSEFQEEHGFVDIIVQRKDLKETIGKILYIHRKDV